MSWGEHGSGRFCVGDGSQLHAWPTLLIAASRLQPSPPTDPLHSGDLRLLDIWAQVLPVCSFPQGSMSWQSTWVWAGLCNSAMSTSI